MTNDSLRQWLDDIKVERDAYLGRLEEKLNETDEIISAATREVERLRSVKIWWQTASPIEAGAQLEDIRRRDENDRLLVEKNAALNLSRQNAIGAAKHLGKAIVSPASGWATSIPLYSGIAAGGIAAFFSIFMWGLDGLMLGLVGIVFGALGAFAGIKFFDANFVIDLSLERTVGDAIREMSQPVRDTYFKDGDSR